MSTTKNISQHAKTIPTVFLHGFSGDGNGLRAFAELYEGKGAICINMPGFGGTKGPSPGKSHDIRMYCAGVWQEIRRVVPAGSVNLVGHSHGAMIGYVLAVQHPAEVARLDLFCPVARPRLIPRLSIKFIELLQMIGLSPERIIRMAAHPALVGLVTRYSFHPDWSAEDRDRITRMRVREARFYSPIMFDLMRQTLQFQEDMADSYCATPTNLCSVSDDNVASATDYEWYANHAAVKKMKMISGGHLCVVANPERVVKLFGRGT